MWWTIPAGCLCCFFKGLLKADAPLKRDQTRQRWAFKGRNGTRSWWRVMADLQAQRGCRPWWRAAPSAPLQPEEPPAWTVSPSGLLDSGLHTVLHLCHGPQRTRLPLNRLTWGTGHFLSFSPTNTLPRHLWLPASGPSCLEFSSFSSVALRANMCLTHWSTRSSVQSALQTVETSVKLQKMPIYERTNSRKHTYTEHTLSNTQNVLVEVREGFRNATFALLYTSEM